MDLPVNNKSETESKEPEIPKPTLIEEFKHAFQDIWAPLVCSENYLPGSSSSDSRQDSDIRANIENSISRFVDIARQLETWFAQRRLLLKTSEKKLEEEIQEIQYELDRKNKMIADIAEQAAKFRDELTIAVPEIKDVI